MKPKARVAVFAPIGCISIAMAHTGYSRISSLQAYVVELRFYQSHEPWTIMAHIMLIPSLLVSRHGTLLAALPTYSTAISCNWTWYDLTTICEIYISESPLHRFTSFHLPLRVHRDAGVQIVQEIHQNTKESNQSNGTIRLQLSKMPRGETPRKLVSNYWNQIEVVCFSFFWGGVRSPNEYNKYVP